jgi:hypothetical protein
MRDGWAVAILGSGLDPRYEGTKRLLPALFLSLLQSEEYDVHGLSVRSPMSLAIFPDDSRGSVTMRGLCGPQNTVPRIPLS